MSEPFTYHRLTLGGQLIIDGRGWVVASYASDGTRFEAWHPDDPLAAMRSADAARDEYEQTREEP